VPSSLDDRLSGTTIEIRVASSMDDSECEAPADEVHEEPGRHGDPLWSINEDEQDGHDDRRDQRADQDKALCVPKTLFLPGDPHRSRLVRVPSSRSAIGTLAIT